MLFPQGGVDEQGSDDGGEASCVNAPDGETAFGVDERSKEDSVFVDTNLFSFLLRSLWGRCRSYRAFGVSR